MYQIPVKHLLHAPVDIVRKPAHIKPLDVARALHESDHCHIRAHQKQHIGKNFFPCKYIQQALCKPSFKPRSREQSDIINQAGNRHRKQRLPLRHKVAPDLIRFFPGSPDSRFFPVAHRRPFSHPFLLCPSVPLPAKIQTGFLFSISDTVDPAFRKSARFLIRPVPPSATHKTSIQC